MKILHAIADSFFLWLEKIREQHILPFAKTGDKGDEQ